MVDDVALKPEPKADESANGSAEETAFDLLPNAAHLLSSPAKGSPLSLKGSPERKYCKGLKSMGNWLIVEDVLCVCLLWNIAATNMYSHTLEGQHSQQHLPMLRTYPCNGWILMLCKNIQVTLLLLKMYGIALR